MGNHWDTGRSKEILVTKVLEPPNTRVYFCTVKGVVHIKLDMKTFTLHNFKVQITKVILSTVAPDPEIENKGVVFILSNIKEQEEALLDKELAEVGRAAGSGFSYVSLLNAVQQHAQGGREVTQDGALANGDRKWDAAPRDSIQ